MQFETLNMIRTDIESVIGQIENQLNDDDYTPVILLGKSGVGKTEAVCKLAKNLNIGYVELRLSHYQESDLIGLPYIDKDGMTAHAPTRLLPPTEDRGQGILLLDEVTSSPRSMRSAVYQLLDESRRLGEYKLPERWLVVAAGNGPDDGGDFRGMEPAFLSRGFCWRVEENFTVWKNWAEKNDIHPIIISYLAFKPDSLHVMDVDKPYDMIACPRNWVKLSTQLKNMERRTPDRVVHNSDELEFAAAGCVGLSCAPDFCTFYMHNDEIIDAAQIAGGSIPAAQMGELSEEGLYITMQSYVRYLADQMKQSISDRYGRLDRPDHDFQKYLADNMKWIVEVGMTVRLDSAAAMINDLNAATEGRLASLVLTEDFNSLCPEFGEFALMIRSAVR